MKKVLNITILAAIIISLGSLSACKGKKKLAKTVDPPKGEVEIIIPCSGPDYFSTKKHFRANAVGESLDQMTSKKKAVAEAKALLAGDISTTMKIVGDNYVNSREYNNKEEVLERFEQNSRTVVDQKLNGVRTICEKLVRTADGKYKTYIAIELSGDEMVSAYNERLTKDEMIRIDYDYEKFKETFEKEMDKRR
jgi:hypothetical protein